MNRGQQVDLYKVLNKVRKGEMTREDLNKIVMADALDVKIALVAVLQSEEKVS